MLGVTQENVNRLWELIQTGKVAAKKIQLGNLTTERGMYFLHAQYSRVLSACYVISDNDDDFACIDLVDGAIDLNLYNDTIVFVVSSDVIIDHLIRPHSQSPTPPTQPNTAPAIADKNSILFL